MPKNKTLKGIVHWEKFICYCFLLLLGFPSCNAQSKTQKPNEINTQQFIYKNQKYDIVTIDLRKTVVQFFWKNKEGQLIRSLENLKNEVAKNGNELLFAMNAGMYQRDRNPQGLYIVKMRCTSMVLFPELTFQIWRERIWMEILG